MEEVEVGDELQRPGTGDVVGVVVELFPRIWSRTETVDRSFSQPDEDMSDGESGGEGAGCGEGARCVLMSTIVNSAALGF